MNIAIHMDQVPKEDGVSWEDYPEGTSIILDDRRPERDPVTFQLIRKPRRALIYPEDIIKAQKGEYMPTDKFLSLLRNGNKLLCPLCRKGHINPIFNPEKSTHFYCDCCGIDMRLD